MFFDKFLKSSSKKDLSMKKKSSSTVHHRKIKNSLDESEEDILKSLGNPGDLFIHRLGDGDHIFAVAIYFETLVDSNLLGQHVIEPLNKFIQRKTGTLNENQVKLLLSASKLTDTDDLHTAIDRLLSGYALIMASDSQTIFTVSLPGFAHRAIEDAQTERTVKGPREGFNETINDNISLIRRYIKDPNLRLQKKIIGERTKTEIAVVYLNDVANPDIVKEVHKRLEQIKIDGILESGYIAEMITDRRLTPFPLIQETERSDKVAAAILEGRVVILVDRSNFNIIVPVTSNEFYQTQEDFYLNWMTGSAVRIVKALGTIIAVTLPGFYIAVIAVNPELLPPGVIQLEASARTQMPFPAVIEILTTLFAYEILREASARFTTNMNMIVGVGGGIVMGLAAINAGLVSGITVALSAFCVLATFTTTNPAKEQAWRWIRYILFFAGSVFGFMGVVAAGVMVLAHMAGLKSFGVSYLAPWAPPIMADIADSPVRLPWWLSYKRPPTYRPQQQDRLGENEGEDEA